MKILFTHRILVHCIAPVITELLFTSPVERLLTEREVAVMGIGDLCWKHCPLRSDITKGALLRPTGSGPYIGRQCLYKQGRSATGEQL
jgi:hypothetical protein